MTMLFHACKLLWATHRDGARAQPAQGGKPLSPLMILCALVVLGLAVLALLPLGNAELYRAMWDGNEVRALELITAGANPNSRFGATHKIETENRAVLLNPLHFALARALPKVAVALIEAGADPNSRDDEGKTALIVAANKDYTEVIRALLAKGADPNAASSSDGETQLHYGPHGPGGRYPGFGKIPKSLKPEIREILIKAGAK
jgi:ankyrin repeat protein